MLLNALLRGRGGITLLQEIIGVLLLIDILILEVVIIFVVLFIIFACIFRLVPGVLEDLLRRHKSSVSFRVCHSRILGYRLLRFARLLVNNHNRWALFNSIKLWFRSKRFV